MSCAWRVSLGSFSLTCPPAWPPGFSGHILVTFLAIPQGQGWLLTLAEAIIWPGLGTILEGALRGPGDCPWIPGLMELWPDSGLQTWMETYC